MPILIESIISVSNHPSLIVVIVIVVNNCSFYERKRLSEVRFRMISSIDYLHLRKKHEN